MIQAGFPFASPQTRSPVHCPFHTDISLAATSLLLLMANNKHAHAPRNEGYNPQDLEESCPGWHHPFWIGFRKTVVKPKRCCPDSKAEQDR